MKAASLFPSCSVLLRCGLIKLRWGLPGLCVCVCVCVWNGCVMILWESVASLLHCVKELCDICSGVNNENTEKDKERQSVY